MNEVLIAYIMECIKSAKIALVAVFVGIATVPTYAQVNPLFDGMVESGPQGGPTGPGANAPLQPPAPAQIPPMPPLPPAMDMAPSQPPSMDSVQFAPEQPQGSNIPEDPTIMQQPQPMPPMPQVPPPLPTTPVNNTPPPLPPSMPVPPPQPPTAPTPPAPSAPTPTPIQARPVPDVKPTQSADNIKVNVDQLELGKISRTISSSELKKMDYELVATEKSKPINLVLGSQQVKLEVPIIGYLIKERRVNPSPLDVPVASVDAGYRFSDTDMRNFKIMYNTMLEKANVNSTTSERFREILKSLENFIRELDARKQSES